MRGLGRILVAVTALVVLGLPHATLAGEGAGPCDLHQRDGEPVRHFSKRLINCAVDRWDVPGGAEKAICIADAESHLNPEAVSAGGEYLGLFQHSAEAWPGRYEEWTRPAWQLDESALSGRTNAIVTARMVNANGWAPWSGVDGC